MKNFLKSAWIIFCIILLLLFIISCFSAYISPGFFSYMPLLAIAFPYLFIITLVAALISLFIKKIFGIVMLVCMPPGLINVSHVVAFNFPHTFSDKKNDSTLRVMTWNVQDFINLSEKSDIRSKMLQIISQKNPDVLCVQEFTNVENGKYRVSVRKELDSLGYTFHFFSNDAVTTNHFDRVVMRGSAVFSKIPFTDSGRTAIRKEGMNENLIYVTVKFNNTPLRIYTTHLASFALFKDTASSIDIYEMTYDRKRVIQYKLREVEQLHQKEAEIIHKTLLKTRMPVIYCGDMNAVPSSYTYRLLKNNFQDAFLAKGSGIGATFYKIPMLRIDYCLADKRFKIMNCTVVNQKLSDHYPVVTDLQWK